MPTDDDARDPHAPLRDDVRLLGDLLGEVLVDQEGQALLDAVAAVRRASQQARTGDRQAAERLRAILDGLDDAATVSVARAFLHFLALANIAEQHHRVRRRRVHARSSDARPQRGSVEEAMERLLRSGIAPQHIHEAIDAVDVELVLTAHPTQTTRRTLLLKHLRVEHLLEQLDAAVTPAERDATANALRRELTAIWATPELRQVRPTPEEEARGGFAIIEHVLWEAVPAHVRELDRCVRGALGERLPPDTAPIRFASWMGGDRDGNPAVRPETTERVVWLGRWMAADLYLRDIEVLRATLSMQDATPELIARAGRTHEPYRGLLGQMQRRLIATKTWIEARLDGVDDAGPPGYDDAAQFGAELRALYDSLQATGRGVVAEGELLDTLRRFACFGLDLVGLDVRQEAGRHRDAIDALAAEMGWTGWADADEADRCTKLEGLLAAGELSHARPALDRLIARGDDVADVLATMDVLFRLPRSALRSYVISMASKPSDVLTVLALQRAAGMDDPLPVVPLFETLSDLEHAVAVTRTLLESKVFRNHVGRELQVMIGYSDSAKDAGVLSAAWALYRAQEGLSALADEHGLRLTVFHGRGGSVGRGGGPAHAAIGALPPGSVRRRLRVTEQGEVIQARFGSLGIALRSLELYVSAVLEATLLPGVEPRETWRRDMDTMATASEQAYRSVLAADGFVPYFRSATPEQELALLRIGSRPARRGGGDDLSALRAIPWVFAWMQNRLIVPGWLGVGEGFAAVREAGDDGRLRAMYDEWPFFRATVDLVEMGLAKADLSVSRSYHDELVADALKPIGEMLFELFEETATELLRVTGEDTLLVRHPVLQRSIAVRNPYVDPLNLVQVSLLRRMRADASDDPMLREALELTITGVAQGMRNTG